MPRLLSTKVILYLFILLMLDFCLMPLLRFVSVQPLLLYLMVPYAIFQWHWEKTMPMAVAVGLLKDLTGSQPLGVETVVLVMMSLALDWVVQKVDRKSMVIQLFLAIFFIFLTLFLILSLSSFLSVSSGISWHALSVSLGCALMTGFVMPLFFYLTARWFHDSTALKQYELFT